jgi:hypothetical protein
MDSVTRQAHLARVARQLAWTTPCVLAVPAAIGYLLTAGFLSFSFFAAAAGGVGWIVALGARVPVKWIVQRWNPAYTNIALIAASGPLEESARLIVLLMLGTESSTAVSSGIGWSAAEIVFFLCTGYASIRLARSNPEDPGSRFFIAAAAASKGGVMLAVMERIGVTMAHVGFALLIAAHPAFALLTSVLHSALNLCVVVLIQRSPLLTELIVLASGSIALIIGLHFSA